MKGTREKGHPGIYRLTLDEHGIPCLDGKKLLGVTSYTIDVDSPSIATLTVSLCVTLNSEISFDICGDDVECDEISPVTRSEEIISAVQRGLDEANRDIASKSRGNSSEQS